MYFKFEKCIMIYKVTKDPLFETNPGLASNAIFKECTERELRYIFLLYDIESPFIKMRFVDRKAKAALEAGYRKEKDGKRFDKNARQVLDGKTRRVNAAIQEFKTIQLAANTNYAVLAALKAQIDRTITFIETASSESAKELLDINKLATGLEGLIQTKLNIERLLNVEDTIEDDENQEMVDNLSMLDKLNAGE